LSRLCSRSFNACRPIRAYNWHSLRSKLLGDNDIETACDPISGRICLAEVCRGRKGFLLS
jgi:hypothetical protein